MQTLPGRHSESGQGSFAEFSRRYVALFHNADNTAGRDLSNLFRELLQYLRGLFEFNFLKYALHDPITGAMRVFVIEETVLLPPDALEFAVQDSPSGWVWMHHQPLVIGELQAETRFRPAVEVFLRKGFRSLILLPMSTPRKKLGALGFGSTRPRDCDPSLI